ncbi:MAG: hypothetical protein AB8B82_16415 [Roseovarius sp.]
MTLSDRLDDLRHQVPGCSLVSFGDMSTGLALRTSAARSYKQDYLEDVLRQAVENFQLSDLMTDLMSEGNDLVVVATPDEVRVFVRSRAGNADIVCCICDSASEIPQITQAAQQILSDMAQAA